MLLKTLLFSTFIAIVLAAPIHELDRRAKCADGKDSPCACGGAFGLRDPNVKSKCPKTSSFQFVKPIDPTDGTIHLVASNAGSNLQCDHIVELQFIASEMDSNPAICKHFRTAPTGTADFATLFKVINNQPNVELVEGTVNNAKGKLFSGQKLSTTTVKAADGVVSYMTLLKGAKTNAAAKAIDDQMNVIMGNNGFKNFVSEFNSKVNTVIASAAKQKAALKPKPKAKPAPKKAPAGGIQKKPAGKVGTAKKTTAKTASATPKKATPKKATAPAKAKPATSAKTKTTVAKTKPAIKVPATKKPVTKATTTKKPATKKPVTKKPAAKKPATKKPTPKKPVLTKPAGVKKPVAKKPAVKKVKPVKKVKSKKV